MSAARLASTLILLAFSFQVSSQEQVVDQLLQQQLTAQEQAEYRSRLSEASDAAERREINARYEKLASDRVPPVKPDKKAARHGNHASPPGQANTSKKTHSPSGSKNRPQKSGR